jgi:dihydrofolate reductase
MAVSFGRRERYRLPRLHTRRRRAGYGFLYLPVDAAPYHQARQRAARHLAVQPAPWVFSSRTLPEIAGADTRFVKGDVRPVHQHMREAALGKNLWIVGGGDLAGQFYDAGLLDELIVQIGSVTLGSGKPLLPRNIASPPMKLLSVKQIGSGFAELRYELPQETNRIE